VLARHFGAQSCISVLPSCISILVLH